VELFAPLSDDQRIDLEATIKRRFMVPLGIQVKSTMTLFDNRQITFAFAVSKEALVTHDLFYYFFAYLSRRDLGLVDPLFFIPSREVHRHIEPKPLGNGRYVVEIEASIRPDSHDRFVPYRCARTNLGARVLQVIRQGQRRGLSAESMPSSLFGIAGMIWGGLQTPRRGQ
jgi:hypothetical protein